MHYIDTVRIVIGNVDMFYPLFESIVLFLLGSLGYKLFSGVKGFGKILCCLFIIMVMFSFNSLIEFFIYL